jgi:acetyl esterase/lipase
MSFSEAFKGAKAELATIHSPFERLKRIGVFAKIIGAELLGTLQIIPYGIRSQALYRSIPEIRADKTHQGSIATARNLCYGSRERNTLDIYLPSEAEIDHTSILNLKSSNLEANSSSNTANKLGKNATRTDADPKDALSDTATTTSNNQLPVVLFCHGGIWATGEKWHYAPLATRLAQAGIVTAIMNYSLYPTAQASEMAAEVSQALTWTLDNISRFGGDPGNVTLTGHSAGAQLCAMALLNRACSLQGKEERKGSEKLITEAEVGFSSAFNDGRMPRRFVGMAGVYDIAKHYEYEQGRLKAVEGDDNSRILLIQFYCIL